MNIQNHVPWGLDRIDQITLPLDGQYDYNSNNTGKGIPVFIVDTGMIRIISNSS